MKSKIFSTLIGVLLCLACSKGGGGPATETPVSPNRLVIKDLEFANGIHSFGLDTSLRLTISKKYRLRGLVAFRDPESKVYEDSLTGDYFLTASLIPYDTGHINSDAYLATDRKTVRIEEGILNTTVDLAFEFGQLPLLVSPSQLLIQLEPTSPDLPRGISLTARFDNFGSQGRLAMEKLSIPANVMIEAYLHDKKLDRTTPLNTDTRKMFETSLNLKPFGLDSLQGIGVSGQEFDSVVKALLSKKDVPLDSARKFCPWIYPYPSNEWRQCTQNPGQMLSLFGSRHVKKILSAPEVDSVDSYFVQLSDFKFNEFTTSDEQLSGVRDTKFLFNLTSVSVGSRVEAKLGIEALGSGAGVVSSAGLMNETGFRFGREWFNVRQQINRQTREGVRTSNSKNRILQIQEWRLSFGAETDRCLSVTAKAQGRNGVLLCRPEANKAISERWFFVNQTAFNVGVPIPLNGNSNDRLISAAIRGQSNYNEMMSIFDSDVEVVFQKSSQGKGPLVDGSFPGLLAN